MAVDTVSLDKAAQFTIGKPLTDLSDTERATLRVVCAWATEAVSTYLKGSPCPDAVREAATLRAVYFDWHTRYARRPGDGGMLDTRFRRDAPLSPLRASGAMAMLSPYKRRSVGMGAA